MGRADYLVLGDWNVVCYQCGFKAKASQMEKNWQGFYVHPEHNEPRQEQDFVRGVPDNQTPPWVQPMPTAIYTYTNVVIGFGDGITPSFQLGDGLYVTTITGVAVAGVPSTYTDNGRGLITPTSIPLVGQQVTASGSEAVA